MQEQGRDIKPVTVSTTCFSQIAIFTEKENLDAYLSRFERLAISHDCLTEEWAINLSALLY